MIKYVIGDATDPIVKGDRYIVHVCNNVGGWGRGFVLALSKRWKWPEYHYRAEFAAGRVILGSTYFVPVDQGIDGVTFVVNMVAQEGYGAKNARPHRTNEPDARPPIRYDALRICLLDVASDIRDNHPNATVHMPRIGCGLAGGRWEDVEPLINETLSDIDIYVYDLAVS